MPSPEEVVQRQLEAYNVRDVVAFADCYAVDAVLLSGGGEVRMRGREAILAAYGAVFAVHPQVRAEIGSRVVIGPWVVDEELIHGRPDQGPLRTVVVYHVSAGLIDEVRFLEEG